jgi:hypothetical protein
VVLLDTDQDTGGPENDLLGRMIHSFIVKIWREEADQGRSPKWRGHITHVPSNERRYLESLDDILDFMKPYLQAMGMHVDFRWKLKQWLAKKKHSSQRQ